MQQNSNAFDIVNLLSKYLENSLAPEEEQLLQNWISQTPENRKLFQELTFEESVKRELKSFRSFDEHKAFKEFKNAISLKPKARVLSFKTLWWAAAVLVLIVPASIFLLKHARHETVISKTEHTPAKEADVAPGGNVATLTLSTGEVIALDESALGTISKEGEVNIVKAGDGALNYAKAGNKVTEVLYNTVSTPRGGQYKLTLSDGTKVWLNAASSLHFPASFQGQSREVEMEGEVYFEIAKNAKQPFIVKANDVKILVTGTWFNVNAYADEQSLKVTLLEGGITLNNQNTKLNLMPHQQAEVLKEGNIRLHKNINTEEVVAWKDGYFHFNKAGLQSVMRQISRWYNVDVRWQGTPKNRVFKGEMQRNLELSQVVKILQKNDINIELTGKTLIVNY